MKITYVERITTKTAWNRNKMCTCGEREYQIVEQLEPETHSPWSIRCPFCGRETPQYSIKEGAMAVWLRPSEKGDG